MPQRRPSDMPTIDPEARRPASQASWQPDPASAQALLALIDAGGRQPVGPAPQSFVPRVEGAGAQQGGLMDWLATALLGPVSAPQGRSTPEYIEHFRQMNPGPTDEDAFRAAQLARDEVDKGKRGFDRDLNLRDAEHALFSQSLIDNYGPIIGRLMVGMTVPGYSAAKAVAQSGIPGAAPAVQAITGMPLHKSSPPDLRELAWGLRPLFGRP